MKKMVFLLCCIILTACEQNTKEPQEQEEPDSSSFTDKLQPSRTRTVSLLPEARQEVGQWLAYATAQDEVESIKSKTGKEIMSNSRSLVQIMESLKTTLPDSLRTPAVEARVNVLQTKAHVLHQLASKKEKKASEILEVANDIVVEFDNFKLQLNELFLKAPGDFEIELDREFEEAAETDSLPPPLGRE